MTFVPDTCATVTAKWSKGTGGPSGDEAQNLVPDVAHTLVGEGFDASEDGTGRGTPIVPQPIGFDRYNNASTGDVAHTLAAGKGYPDVMPHVLDAVHQPAYGMTGGTGDESAFPKQQPALTASHGQPGNVAVPAVLLTMREGKDGGGKGPLLAEDESLTLATGNGQVLFDPVPIQNAATRTESAAKTPSPDAQGRLRLRDPGLGIGEPGDPQYTLDATSPHAVGPVAFAWQAGGDGTSSGSFADDGTTPTLPRNQTLATTTAYGVRRLTPVECERLQGFPDGWTEPARSDSARYKALGNAVTVNVPEWLFRRMLETA